MNVQAKTATSNRTMDKIMSVIGDLPSSPGVVSLVMGMTSDLNTDIRALSRALSADQSMTVKVLRLSNSPFYGRSRGVTTLEEAIMILGFFTLRSLVVATSTHALFKNEDPTGYEEKLWEHSLSTAMAARIISSHTHSNVIEKAFICGLMHDLGKLIFLQKMPDEYQKLVSRVESEGKTFMELEDEVFGFNHAELGQAILENWSFPDEFCVAIRDHHNPEPISAEKPAAPISLIVNLANVLAKEIGVGFSETKSCDIADLPAAKFLGLDTETLQKMTKKLKTAFDEEKRRFRE
ncbi:MAG: HDOD domain-containing protein [candidate division Zixibacteria bacterium]|nr:HDOD domain-containing protein [candidate division Zixibacteria bacterium]